MAARSHLSRRYSRSNSSFCRKRNVDRLRKRGTRFSRTARVCKRRKKLDGYPIQSEEIHPEKIFFPPASRPFSAPISTSKASATDRNRDPFNAYPPFPFPLQRATIIGCHAS